jgi:uncharacterized membrane protein YccC
MRLLATMETLKGFSSRLQEISFFEGQRVLHAFKTALALVLGAGICMQLEFPQPRTAMVTVVILMMHQQAGMVIARGFYRFIGMTIGGSFGLLLIACFPQQPIPFYLGLAIWIGVCVWGAAYFRNYQSYGYVLAGYATAIVAVPAWNAPYDVFDNLIYTLSEVAVGVLCASAVSALVFPQQVGKELLQAGERHATDLVAFARRLLGSKLSEDDLYALQLKLIGERAQIEALRSAAVFEDPALRLSNPLMTRLNQEFLDVNAGFHALRRIRDRVEESNDIRLTSLFDEALSILPLTGENAVLTIEKIQALKKRIDEFLSSVLLVVESLSGDMEKMHRENVKSASALLYFAMDDLASYLADFVALHTSAPNAPSRDGGAPRTLRIVSSANDMAATAKSEKARLTPHPTLSNLSRVETS